MTIRRRSTVRALEVAPAVMAFCQVCGSVLEVGSRYCDHEHVMCRVCHAQHVFYQHGKYGDDSLDCEYVDGTGKAYWRFRGWLSSLI